MSKSVDERIVKMDFNNANFQERVKDTLSSLADLKKGLNLDSTKNGFAELNSVANGIRLDGLASQVENLGGKFEGLRGIALGALMAIGAKLVDLGTNAVRDFASGLTRAAKDGFGEYETQINAVQTILSNTASKGSTLKDVNAALDELNGYADKTIYNFTEMTKNIGTFTVAGIGLEDATAAIKGFSNMAALAGANSQSASGAMYQLSQAMSSGVVRLQDWMSIEKAGIAGEQFQNALMTTARVHGIAIDDMISRSGSFRNSLSENWLSAELMTETLSIMTGDLNEQQIMSMGYSAEQAKMMLDMAAAASASATQVKTLTQVFETYAEAVGSGWANTWRIVLGDFEEARVLFTEVSDILNGFAGASADARNQQLEVWKELGGRTAIIDGLRNVFQGVMSVINPLRAAMAEVFPPTWGTTLAAVSIAFRDITAGMVLSEEASEGIRRIMVPVFQALKFVLDIVAGAFRIFFDNISIGFEVLGILGSFISPIIKFLLDLGDGSTKATADVSSFVTMLINLRRSGIEPILEWFKKLAVAWDEFLNGDPKSFQNAFADAGKSIANIGQSILDKWHAVGDFFASIFVPLGQRIESNWSGIGKVVSDIWSALKNMGNDMGGVFDALGAGFKFLIESIDLTAVLGVLNAVMTVGIGLMIKNLVGSVKGVFDGFAGTFGAVKDSFGALTGTLEQMQKKLKADMLVKIAIAIGILAAALLVLSFIDPERLLSAVTGMATAFVVLMGGLVILDKVISGEGLAKLPVLGVALMLLSGSINILASAVAKMGALSWDELLRGLTGLAGAMVLLVGAAVVMSKFNNDILKSSVAMLVMATAITALAGAVAIFGVMPVDMLVQGGIAVAAILGGLVIAAAALEKFAPKMVMSAVGLMAMAVALNLLVIPITTLGLLPYPILMQGLLTLGIMMTGLVIAATMMSEMGPKMAIAAVGLMAMAAAINMLVGPVLILGAISMETLIQGLVGLAAVMAILVIAAQSMNTAIVGAGAMIVMAGAILILSAALSILGAMEPMAIVQALIALAAAFIIIGIAGLVLGPLAPALLAVSVAMLAFSGAIMIVAVATVVFSAGLMALGPALIAVTAGLMVFAQMAPKIAEAVPAFLGIGAGLLVFGAGAAVAGAGILILGAGLVILGAGLALVGAVGLMGSTALTVFVLALGKLAGEMPNMLAMAGTLTVLGAAMVVIGAGLLLVAAGGIAAAMALVTLVPLGALIIGSFALITQAVNKLLPQTEKVGELSANFKKLGTAIGTVGTAGSGAASGMRAVTTGFTSMGTSSLAAGNQIRTSSAAIAVAMREISTTSTATSASYRVMVTAILASAAQLNTGLSASARQVSATSSTIGRSVGPAVIGAINASNGGMYQAGVSVGRAISDGMAAGINSGAGYVSSAARRVAQNALNASKRELGVASPSKEYFKIGVWNDEGMADGMLNGMGVITSASSTVGRAAIDAVKETLAKLSDTVEFEGDMQPVVRPVLDLTDFRKEAGKVGDAFGGVSVDLSGNVDSAVATQNAIRATRLASVKEKESVTDAPVKEITFIQNNNSPKALSEAEIYRNTKNQISVAKGELTK